MIGIRFTEHLPSAVRVINQLLSNSMHGGFLDLEIPAILCNNRNSGISTLGKDHRTRLLRILLR